MPNPTNSAAQKSFFIFVKDTNTGEIKRLAIPADLQVGTMGKPAALDLFGRLSLSISDYSIQNPTNSTISIQNQDTIVAIDATIVPTSGRITVALPTRPRNGQVHFIKDMSGTASTTPLDVTPPNGVTIDGEVLITIDDDYGSLALCWFNSQWRMIVAGVGGAGGGGAPTNATYLVTSLNATLTNERRLVGASGQITTSDGGANADFTLGLPDVGPGVGSFTNTSISIDAKGRVTAAASGTPDAPVGAEYVVITNDATLTAERALSASIGLRIIDGGANSTVSLLINDNVVATLSGSTFYGNVVAQAGLSGSLQRTSSGISYLVAGSNVTITSQSNGQVIISSTGGGGGGSDVDWVDTGTQLRTTSSVAIDGSGGFAEDQGTDVYFYVSGTINTQPSASANMSLFGGDVRVSGSITVGSGSVKITSNDIQFGGDVTKRIEFDGLRIRTTAALSAASGLSGSLQQVSTNLPYLIAQGNISITTQSNGQIMISGSGGGESASSPETQVFVSNLATWVESGSMPEARARCAYFVAGGKIWMITGQTTAHVVTNNILTASVNTPTIWGSSSVPFPTALSAPFYCVIDDKAYIIGGRNGTSTSTNTIYSASLSNLESWSDTGLTFPNSRDREISQQLFVGTDKIVIVGAYNRPSNTGDQIIYTASISNPIVWGTSTTTFPADIQNSCAYVVNDRAYIAAGADPGSDFATRGVYVSDINDLINWRSLPNAFPVDVGYPAGGVAGNTIYAVAGRDNAGTRVNSIYAASVDNPTSFNLAGLFPYINIPTDLVFVSGTCYMFGGNGPTGFTASITRTTSPMSASFRGTIVDNYGAIPVVLTKTGQPTTYRRSERIGIPEWFTNLGTGSLGYTP